MSDPYITEKMKTYRHVSSLDAEKCRDDYRRMAKVAVDIGLEKEMIGNFIDRFLESMITAYHVRVFIEEVEFATLRNIEGVVDDG